MLTPYANVRKFGRELDANANYKYYIRWYLDDAITTESGNNITTEIGGSDFLVVERQRDSGGNYYVKSINSSKIYSLKRNNLGELFRVYMKSYTLETSVNLDTSIKVELELNEINSSGTSNYGTYNIYSKEHNLASNTYTYVLVDDMVNTIRPLEKSDVFSKENGEYTTTTLIQIVRNILTNCGFTNINPYKELVYPYSQKMVANASYALAPSIFDDEDIYGKITCRDMLNYVLQLLGVSLMIDKDGYVIFKSHIYSLTKARDGHHGGTVVDLGIDYGEISNVDSNTTKSFDIRAIRMIGKEYSYTVGYNYQDDEYVENPSNVDAYCIKDNIIVDRVEDYMVENYAKSLLRVFYVNPIEEDYESEIRFYNYETTGIDRLEYMDCFYLDRYFDALYLCLQDTTTIGNVYEETLTNNITDEFIHID